nr:MAG TPA: hypothetical protein [Caudoviricetes sp.]
MAATRQRRAHHGKHTHNQYVANRVRQQVEDNQHFGEMMAVNVSQKDKTIERVRERMSQAYSEIAPHVPDDAIQYLDAYDELIRKYLTEDYGYCTARMPLEEPNHTK